MKELFAEVLIPQKIEKLKSTLTYKVPDSLIKILRPGHEVKVPLRNKKISATIISISNQKPAYPTKEIIEILGEKPLIQEWQIKLMNWISEYYAAPLYKTLELFIPKSITKGTFPKFGLNETPGDTGTLHTLTQNQKKILNEILYGKNRISLIHGITGSGKTEIYLHAAKHFAEQNGQTLILVPEISLTPQMNNYFKKIFDDKVTVIHSKLTNVQKKTAWKNILEERIKVIIGSRSALFAPFQNLKLIVIDEEHEFSYKQDQSPRYHARDVALKMLEFLPNLKIVMGSATPSVETYFKAKNGEYNLLELKTRVHDQSMPKIEIVDMREEMQKKNFSIFSENLQKNIQEVLKRNEQVILFLNKRGTNSAVICRDCGYVEKCDYCNVAMTYHQNDSKLTCHHCGFKKNPPIICPKCKSVAIRFIGSGTQKVEDELARLFPESRTIRADKDTTSKRDSFKQIYNDFKDHKADILIGTQLISHGLHLPKVSLVGIMLADISLLFPDFRTGEKTFQLLTQIAGRAGRIKRNHDFEDKVIIQTYMPENAILKSVQDYNYEGMYEFAINERKIANYPPFSNLIKLTFSHKNETECIKSIQRAKVIIQNQLNAKKLKADIQPYPSYITKIKGKYIYNMLIKGTNLTSKIAAPFQNIEGWKIDIDPISTL